MKDGIKLENQGVAVNNTFFYQRQCEQMSSRLDSKDSKKNCDNTFNRVYKQPVLKVSNSL